MKKIKSYKFIGLCLLAVLMVSSVLGTVYDEPQTTVEINKLSLLDRLSSFITSGSFSTAFGPGTFIDAKPGEYISVRFSMRCQEASDVNKLTVDWLVAGQNNLKGWTQTIDNIGSCEPGKYYEVSFNNILVPQQAEDYCGELLKMYVKHERLTTDEGYVIDTDGDASVINGFEKVATVQVECDANPCNGITGDTTGSRYCVGNDVAISQYTDIVKDGECYTNNKILENCGSVGCSGGVCKTVEDKETEVIVDDNPNTKIYYVIEEKDKECLEKQLTFSESMADNYIFSDEETCNIYAKNRAEADYFELDSNICDLDFGIERTNLVNDICVDMGYDYAGEAGCDVYDLLSINCVNDDSSDEEDTNLEDNNETGMDKQTLFYVFTGLIVSAIIMIIIMIEIKRKK